MPSRKKTIALVIVIVIVLIIAVRVGIGVHRMMTKPSEQTIKPVPVEVIKATKGDVQKSLLISGVTESTNQVEMVSKIPGKIVSLPISLGSFVYAGSTIAVIDRDEPSLGYKDYVVESTISGYVAMIMQDVGDFVSPGMPIAMVVKKGSTKIKCQVTEKDLPYVKEGSEVQIHLNDQTIPGRVTQVSGVIDSLTLSSQVEIRPDETVEKSNLVPGTFVDIEIPLEVRREVISVPKEALVFKNSIANVFVVENDTVKLTPVEVGLREREVVEIKSGLNEGDEVVVVGMGDVEDGSQVIVIGEKDAK
jgi:multidrug efflux pump subunit AcrA (membrane-fusion protein)